MFVALERLTLGEATCGISVLDALWGWTCCLRMIGLLGRVVKWEIDQVIDLVLGETLSLQIIQRIPAAIRHKGQVSPNNIVIDDLSMRMTIGQLKAMLEDKAQGWKPGVMKLIVRETGVLK